MGSRFIAASARLASVTGGAGVGCPAGPRAATAFLTAVAACLGIAALAPWSAGAAPSVGLHASLKPEIPGKSTTVSITVEVTPKGEIVPPPLLEGQLRYPAGLDVQLSGLGIDGCSEATLELLGPKGCPRNSWMGYGSALAELPIKGEAFRETARIAILRTYERHGHPTMLLVAYDEPAVYEQIVLPSELLPASKPFGGRLTIHVPLVSGLPEAPDVSVTQIKLVLGPKSLVYTERVHGKTIRYRPEGIPFPGHCPRSGLPFSIGLRFLDGSEASARTAVRCPRGTRRA